MPLIVEDGTGIPDAESWVSEAETTAYWAKRNLTAWLDAEAADQEASLRVAFDYLTIAYRWPGQPSTIGQRGPWPRVGVPSGRGFFPSNAVPTQVISAQMVLAVEQLGGADLLRRKQVPDRVVVEETRALKGITKTTRYQVTDTDPVSGLQRFPVVDQILAGIAEFGSSGGFGTAKLVKGW